MELQVGDEVLLSTRNLLVQVAAGGSRKLGPLYCGPFTILEKLTSAYKLDLPPHIKVHLVFHVSQLKLYKRPEDSMRTYEKPDPVITLLEKRNVRSKRLLTIKKEGVAEQQKLNI